MGGAWDSYARARDAAGWTWADAQARVGGSSRLAPPPPLTPACLVLLMRGLHTCVSPTTPCLYALRHLIFLCAAEGRQGSLECHQGQHEGDLGPGKQRAALSS